MLYNNYSLFSIDGEDKTLTFQSLHIDRFLNGTSGNPNFAFKYDPDVIFPVKDGNFFYLFSQFSGINNNNCLQFYDHVSDSRSLSRPENKLFLGYQVNSNGELNRNYNRTSYSKISNIPFGPGPQNTTTYSTTQPRDEIVGCSQFDSNNNCVRIKGLNQLTYSYDSTGNLTPSNQCVRWSNSCQNYQRDYTCVPEWNCDPNDPNNSSHRCIQYKDTACGGPYESYSCWPNWRVGYVAPSCTFSHYYTCCVEYGSYYSGGTFKSRLRLYSFSNFENMSITGQNYNITGPTHPTRAITLTIPSDYLKYQNELTTSNNTNYPLHFTSEFNKSIFVSNKYLFKISRSDTNLRITRYSINPNQDYTYGGGSYISSSGTTTSFNLTNTANTNYSLDYFGDDIYFLASGSTSFDFYKLQGFNSSGNTTQFSLNNEVQNKLPINYKNPQAFGILPNGNSADFYFLVKDKVFNTVLGNSIINPPQEPPEAQEFEASIRWNGNVFSRNNISSNRMLDLSSDKFEGSYISPNNNSSSLKFFNNSKFSFYYNINPPTSVLNFENFNGNSYRKFNLAYEDIDFNESVPLFESQYINLNPNSENNFEIIAISEGKGVRINLTNENLNKNFDRYILQNLDKDNRSRIMFYIDCNSPNYSIICSGINFNIKGSIQGQFLTSGFINGNIRDNIVITIHEDSDILVDLISEIRKKKIQNVSSTIIHLNYEF